MLCRASCFQFSAKSSPKVSKVTSWKNSARAVALLLSIPLLSACDPIFSIDGAFFPAWLLCMVGGGFMLGAIRWAVYRMGLEPFVGPKVFVYFCVYLTCTLGLWLGFFHR